MSLTLSDIADGDTISFRSKDSSDLTQWRGTLEARGTYRLVKGYLDPRSTNERVRQVDPTVSSDITTLSYFLITLENQSTSPQLVAFAADWIQPGSLIKVSLSKQVTIKVDDPNNDPVKIVALLAEQGYACTILS